jgi:hypothetical protein
LTVHRRTGLAVLLTGATAAAVAAALVYADAPYLLVFPLLGLGGLAGAWIAQGVAARAFGVNLAAAALALSIAEVYCWFDRPAPDRARYAGRYTEGYFQRDDLLGYGPAPGMRADARKFVGDVLVYDVVYGIDAIGLRRAPPARDGSRSCVLFFGGSVTFGEGVADEQAMPYRVGVRSGGRHRVLNYAFHGYGPHQMLARLEQEQPPGSAGCDAAVGVYQAIPAHVARSAGVAAWDRHGPRYRLTGAGDVVRDGHFDSDPPGAVRRALRLERSWAARRLWGPERALRARDVELYLAIVERARSRFEERFPGGGFHVLLWGTAGERHHDAILAGLRRRGIRVHPVAAMLPGYAREPERYVLGPHDAHPNAEAHDRIAAYVVARIVTEQGGDGDGAIPDVASGDTGKPREADGPTRPPRR